LTISRRTEREFETHQIERRRLSDEIAARFERMIVSGEFAPGDSLPSERDLMERFGVGRPAIREALFALQKMGLVALSSGARARVTAPTADRVLSELAGAAKYFLAAEEGERAFQEARAFFEAGLARHAAVHATDVDLAALKRALEANARAIHDIEEFQRTDVAFHLQLALISRNPIFKAIHDALETWLMQQRRYSLLVPGALKAAYEYHRKIFNAIAAGDSDRAEKAMRDHLTSVAEYYWKAKAGHAAG
jgi:GntR family transcriptional repressor for pyruvate dehydrogenase complex